MGSLPYHRVHGPAQRRVADALALTHDAVRVGMGVASGWAASAGSFGVAGLHLRISSRGRSTIVSARHSATCSAATRRCRSCSLGRSSGLSARHDAMRPFISSSQSPLLGVAFAHTHQEMGSASSSAASNTLLCRQCSKPGARRDGVGGDSKTTCNLFWLCFVYGAVCS
jgi:hypothetical protein